MKNQTTITLVIVITSCLLYGIIDYSLNPFEVITAEDSGRFMFYFFTPLFFYFFGAFFALIPYIFTKNYTVYFNNITRILALIFCLGASLFDITHYFA